MAVLGLNKVYLCYNNTVIIWRTPTNGWTKFTFAKPGPRQTYKWHVLKERNFPYHGCPLYYSEKYFKFIKEIHKSTPLNITWLMVKEWYKLLLEKEITHFSDNLSSAPVLLASKVELEYPDVDWGTPFTLQRKFGLAPEQKTFLFKLVQSLLPNKERLARVGSTSLAAKGALAHHLQPPTACNTSPPDSIIPSMRTSNIQNG